MDGSFRQRAHRARFRFVAGSTAEGGDDEPEGSDHRGHEGGDEGAAGGRLSAIRMLLAAIKQREVDSRTAADDAVVLAIVEKLIKQRKDAIAQFQPVIAPTWWPRKRSR
jgi:hypothetical protein